MITKLFCVARVGVVISLVFGGDVLARTINVWETACSLRDSLNQASCSGTSTNAVRRRQDASFDNVSRRADEFAPTPSACTCTTPFFNIWSVCTLFESRSNQLPLLKDWTTQCQNANILFQNSSQESLGNTRLPQWSKAAVVGDQVFDVAGVVNRAIAALPTQWTPLQITAPIASAVVVACILGLIYFVKSFSPRQKRYSRTPYDTRRISTISTEKEKRSVFERMQSGMSALRVERVKSEEPKGDWMIDPSDPEASQLGGATNGINGAGAGTKKLSSASTGSTTTQPTTNLSWGPLDLTSSRLDQFPAPPTTFTNPFQPRPTTPQQHIRAHSSQQQHQLLVDNIEDNEDDYHESRFHDPLSPHPPLTSRWSESGHVTPPMGKSGSIVYPHWAPPTGKTSWNVFKGLHNPFKKKPVRVQAVPPRAGFRLDDYDRNTESMLSGVVSKSSSVLRGGDEESIIGGYQNSAIMGEVPGGIDDFSGPLHRAQDSRGDDDERATLISREERRQNHVFLISKDGRENFSISGMTSESGTNLSSTINIGVESPTASTVSSFKPLSAGGIRSDTTKVPTTVIPPPPRLPPPTSPPNPIESSRGKCPLANLPEEHLLPVIRERSGSGSTASSGRWELIAVDQSSGPAAPPNLLLPPLKSVYQAERYPSVESLTSSASGSGNSSRAYGSFGTVGSSSGGTLQPRSLPQGQQHSKAQSLSAIIPPATPIPAAVTTYQHLVPPSHTPVPPPHRRGLFEDDATSSFYQQPAGSNVNLGATSPLSNLASLGLTSSGTHSRTGSLEPSNRKSNPQNLFPASVRAAGYSGGKGMVSAVAQPQQRGGVNDNYRDE